SQDNGWLATLGNAVLMRVAPRTAPAFSEQPQDLSLIAGQDATFSVRGYGPGPLQLRWLYNGHPILGATNVTLRLPFIATSQSGSYQAVLTNSSGSITSRIANLQVRPTRGLVGYYGDSISPSFSMEQSILAAGFTPLLISDITTYDLSR